MTGRARFVQQSLSHSAPHQTEPVPGERLPNISESFSQTERGAKALRGGLNLARVAGYDREVPWLCRYLRTLDALGVAQDHPIPRVTHATSGPGRQRVETARHRSLSTARAGMASPDCNVCAGTIFATVDSRAAHPHDTKTLPTRKRSCALRKGHHPHGTNYCRLIRQPH